MGVDKRPIGVFDSGLGGLTAAAELVSLLPGEDIIYFGDTGRVPYGSRSGEAIIKYARQDVAFLRTFDLKAIVIACGTVSTTALDTLTAENDIPIYGVVEPAALAAVAATKNGRVGLIGTQATIRSGAYEARMARENPAVTVAAAACPLFVPLVENGRFTAGDRVAELVAEEYLSPIKAQGVDTLVLGCTHYPLLMDVIGAFMGPQVTLINVGAACAAAVAAALKAQDKLNSPGHVGQSRYFVSDRPDDFSRLASTFLGREVTAAQQVDIWKF